MKVRLKKTWTIERTFEYDVEDSYFKKQYKTQKGFKDQFAKNPNTIINYLTKINCETVEDVESDGIFDVSVTRD